MIDTHLAIFRGKQIRRAIYHTEWWFVINDVIESLTDSRDPAQYFKRLKTRDNELAKLTEKGGVQFVPPLMLEIETPERKSGQSVSTSQNFLYTTQNKKLLKKQI